MKNVYKFLLTTIMALCLTLYGVAQAPVANAGSDKTICKDQASYTLTEATASDYTTITWTGGTGSFTDASVVQATYNPSVGDKTTGFVNLTITAVKDGWVTPTTDLMKLSFASVPIADAGDDDTMCNDAPYYSLAADASNYTTITWTTSGNGTWGSPSTSGNEDAYYYPSADDKADGFVTLTMSLVNSPCTLVQDDMVLNFQPLATVDAGPASATICEDDSPYSLDATAANYETITWTHDGDGTFSSTSIEDPTYTLGDDDIENGTVTLTITCVHISPCGESSKGPNPKIVTDYIVLTIQKLATVDAGADETICETNSPYSLNATAADYQTITWTSSGNGTFSSTSIEDPTYQLGTTDITNGTVTLTLTAVHESPCGAAKAPINTVDDEVVLTIKKSPTADAGSDATICETDVPYTLAATASNYATITWTTSSADGTFTDASIEDAEYNPSAADINAGSVTLTMTLVNSPCSSDNDAMTLTFKKSPTADAGGNQTICETETSYTLDATATNYSTVTWTTDDGTGTFTADDVVDAEYNPSAADIIAGSVTLKLTAVNDPCDKAENTMTLTFQAIPEADAGADATTCEDTPYTISDATVTAGLYTAVTWTTDGDGTFDDDSALNPEYTPGATDADGAGFVTLTLSAVPNTPCIGAVTDNMILTVKQSPDVDAGADQSICETGTTVTGTVSNYGSLLWTTYGDGTFENAHALSTFYTPGSNDKSAPSVKISLVASPISPCTLMESDDLYLTVNTFLPTVNAGADDTGCSNEPYSLSSASVTNYEHVLWIRFNADGTFSDENIVNPTYSFGPNDITRGYAELKLVAEPISPCDQLVEDAIKLYVQNAASANVGADKTICEDGTYTFTSPYPPVSGTDVWASYVEYVSWSTSGTGTFTYPDTYCKPTGGELAGTDGFTYFKLEEIENTTGHAPNGYAKYMNLSTGLLANSSYTVTWRCGYLAGATASLWIDLDMNGTFETSERLLTNASITNSNTTQNFTVPSGATPGEKRLRIRMRYQVAGGNSSDPCANFQYGETEDYTVFIIGANGNVVPPTYDPSEDDVTAGSVNLTITGRPISPCTIDVTDYMVLNIQSLPEAYAGADETICETDTYTVSDATAANYSSLTWTTDGDGTFSGNPLTITYNPGTDDIDDGGVTLTLTLQPISPCTAYDDDTMDLTIQLKPTVVAGTNTTVCEDICDAGKTANTCLTLDGTVGGGPNDGLLWTTTGTGTIDDDTAEDTYYTPATSDAGQTRTFTLTATCNDPCTGTVEDSYTVKFQELPEITAIGGADPTYCEDATDIPLDATLGGGPYTSVLWTTDGLGDITDGSTLNATYAASADDGDNDVTFTLTVTPESPCETTVDDEFSVYIQKLPVADAGDDDTVCEDGSYTLNDASATDYTSVSWMTTLGDGSFDNESLLHATYTPGNGDITAGSVKLYLLAAPEAPCAIGHTDSITISIQLKPVANAGSDATICADETYTVDDATADNEESVSWDHDGTGSLSDETTLSPTYTPGEGETGDVTLTLTAAPVDPCSTSDDDFMVLTINPLPELTVVELQATKTSPIDWFDASGDIDGGYQLCIDGLAATNYNLDIDGLNSSVALKTGVYNEFFHTGTVPTAPTDPVDFFDYWEDKGVVEGAGSWQGFMWDIINTEEPIFYLYYDGSDYQLIDGLQKQIGNGDQPLTLPGDYPQGGYTFTGTVEDINGCISEEVTIAIEFVHAPIISAGSDATIANNQSYTVDDATAEHYTTITWSHDGNGDLTDDDGLTPTYTADVSDGGNVVTLTMFADPNSPCVQAFDEMEITVKYAPTVVITYPLNNAKLYSKDAITVTGTSNDNDGTVASVELNINNEGWTLANGTGTWDLANTTLNLGANTIAARATDNEGYVSDVVTHNVFIHLQDIPLITGWQLISSFLDPLVPTSIPTIMSGVASNVVTMNATPSGIYAPAPFNINTIGNWNVQKGYKLKMKAPATLTIAGDPLDDNDQNLVAGFYYLPVLTDQLSDITDVFDNPGDPTTNTQEDILYIQDLVNIWWPAGGLSSLSTLTPGRAYYAQLLNPVVVHFPDYQGYLVDEALHAPVIPTGPWALNRSGNTHIISIESKAIYNFEPGFIGAFDAQGTCIGFAEIGQSLSNIGLLIFGNDEYTEVKDGAAEGETINFRYYNSFDQSETELTAEFDITKPQYDGKFTSSGLSMIKSFYKTSTGVGEITSTSIQVYPNPAKDEVTISYTGVAPISDVTITTTEGNAVRSLTLKGSVTTIDISDLAPGVYFVQFNTTVGNKFTKLIVQ